MYRFFDVVYVSTRMGHGDGKENIRRLRILHDRGLQERFFCIFFPPLALQKFR